MLSVLLTHQSVTETDEYLQSSTSHISWQWQQASRLHVYISFIHHTHYSTINGLRFWL